MNMLPHSPVAEKASHPLEDVSDLRRPSSPSLSVACTVLEAGLGRASPAKTFGIDEDGNPVVTQHGTQPAGGTAERFQHSGLAGEILAAVAERLDAMSERQALICAPPPQGRAVWEFVKQKEVADRTDVISRSTTYFPAPAGPGLFGLDFDIKGWPAALRARVEEHQDQLSGVLASVAPTLGQAGCIIRASSSAGVRNRETGQVTDANAGQHRFFIASDGREINHAIEALHNRLVLAGWGYGFVYATGFVEIRSLIDRVASVSSERLWFEGRAQLEDPRLEFIPGGRKATVRNPTGGAVELATIADLSPEERARFENVSDQLRTSLQAEADEKRTVWKAKRRADLITRGVDPAKADKIVGLAVEKHELSGDFLVAFDDGTSATVSEILSDPMAFHRKTGPDPLEPEYGGGRNKAICFSDAHPIKIESQAHGGISYTLVDIGRWFEAQASVEPPASDATPDPALPLFADEREPLDIFGDADPAELGDPPAGSLPPVVERWAKSEARRKGVQLAFPAVAAITVLASAVGASLKIRVRQNDNWAEPASLWAVLVAPPGSTKSPVITAAIAPLRKLDGEWLKADGPIHAEWLKASRSRRKKDDAPVGPEPRVRRATVDDVTSERLIGIFADNPNGLLRDTDELSGLLGGLGAYKKGADGDRSQLLRQFDGGSISRDRQTAGSTHADAALLGILASSQPQKIQSLVKDLGTDGLLQRFLFVMHDGVKRSGIDEAPDGVAAADYERMVSGLKTANYAPSEPLRLTPEAGAAMRAAEGRFTRLQDLPGASPAFQDHVSKWGKFLPRIVLTFHAVEAFQRANAVDPTQPIELATAERAVRFANFLMLHSIRFYERFFGTSEVVSEARWVAGFILTRPKLRELGRRDIYDARKNLRGPDFRPLLSVMAELEALRWVDVTERQNDGPSRWSVNPRVHERFAARADRETLERTEKHAAIIAAGNERRRLSGQFVQDVSERAVAMSVFD